MDINEEIQSGTTPSSSNPSPLFDGLITVTICPTTGGQFEIKISPNDSVENLRKKIARHLQTPHERLKMLFKEKVLDSGQVSEHKLQEGSRVTLLPAVESGFSSTVQGTQRSIIQAIESLSDVQIDDFLSGRSPLTLALRVGDHMMFVQLQLEQSMTNNHISADASGHRASHQRRPVYEQISSATSRCTTATPAHSLSIQTSGKHPSNFVTSSSIADIPPKLSSQDKLVSTGCPGKSEAKSLKSSSGSSNKTSHLDRLETTCSSVGEHSRTPKQQGGKTSAHSENYQYRRASTTCGKITSGVGSLSHHPSSGPGSRMVRQMQRLRRLCGAHQQCVAYSSRELASEISSIVHAAKHSSSSECSGGSSCHRRSGKSSFRDRSRAPSSSSSPYHNTQNQAPPAAGASIDSVTSHGPGIFSGTFSGSLHPNIQDGEGKPKRDPQTILQILNDLLSATNHYEGQTGNIGMLPQLFKEHLNKQSSSSSASNVKADGSELQGALDHLASHYVAALEQQKNPSEPNERRHHRHVPYPHIHRSYPGGFPYNFGSQFTPHAGYAALSQSAEQMHRSRGRNHGSTMVNPSEAGVHRVSGKCSHYGGSSSWNGWCGGSSARRSRKQAPSINVSRLQQLQLENHATRKKMEKLQEKMQQRRERRQIRRENCGPYSKRSVNESGSEHQQSVANLAKIAHATAELEDMQLEEMSYAEDRKSEVTHEAPETVTV